MRARAWVAARVVNNARAQHCIDAAVFVNSVLILLSFDPSFGLTDKEMRNESEMGPHQTPVVTASVVPVKIPQRTFLD